MKVKVDENLPLQVGVELRARLHDVQTVWEEGLSGHADLDIWEGAQREDRVLITQDLDFSDARKFVPGTHHGIVLIRLRSPNAGVWAGHARTDQTGRETPGGINLNGRSRRL